MVVVVVVVVVIDVVVAVSSSDGSSSSSSSSSSKIRCICTHDINIYTYKCMETLFLYNTKIFQNKKIWQLYMYIQN